MRNPDVAPFARFVTVGISTVGSQFLFYLFFYTHYTATHYTSAQICASHGANTAQIHTKTSQYTYNSKLVNWVLYC